ncbi:MAG: SDR family NAD(P)-dependent oxidoreductase [Deltaproteobacteria bacterium]|nr:SDR family NAD(P)-dependent oxidoreductase [Deltaproteobacteria bacterium]MBW2309344.1 SDR family NAD(P)-dependent oxidoreductase [Deltaproteobacteria bacterium]
MELSNKVALVTGGARGLGGGIALALVRENVRVAAADILDPENPEFQDLLDRAKNEGAEIFPLTVDVSDSKSVAEMMEKTLARYDQLDILVNAAGVISVRPVSELEEPEWDRIMDVNAKGVFLCCKAALPHLIVRGEGRIINISSVAGKVGRLGYSHYSASKHAVLGFTKSLAHETAPHNVTVNAVCPGIIETHMWKNVLAPYFGKQRGTSPEAAFESIIQDRIPLRRPQTVEDIAQAVIFLCKAPNITGGSLTVDGGYTML